MHKRRGRLSSWLSCGVALLLCMALLVLAPLPLQKLHNAVFDQFQRWQPRVYNEAPVRIIDLDEASLARLGQWPWPRNRVAELVDKLREAGTAAIVFDVLFAEPDRTSPALLLQDQGLDDALLSQLQALPDHDSQLATALASSNVVLGFATERHAAGNGLPLGRYGLVASEPSPLPFLPHYAGAVRALPILEQAAVGNGALTFEPDTDGVVRKVPLLVALGDEARPSLVAEALRVAQRSPLYRVYTGEAGVERIDIGRVQIPTNRRGELWVHFSVPQAARSISAWQVLAGQAPAGLQGSIALIGTSAQGLQDLRFSPLGGIIPGVEVHAQALEQVLSGDYLQRPGWARAVEALALVLGGLLVCVLALRLRALLAAGLTLLLIALFNGLGWHAFSDQRLLLDLFTPSLGLVLLYSVASISHHVASEREQRWVREAFSRYVSPNLVKHLVDNPGQLTLGGQRQVCSFVFTDLTGFTEMMERQSPEAVVSLLNDYLEQVIGIAFRHDGTLDRIVGDAVAIMFSAPLPQADHAQRALNCALEIDRFAQGYVAQLQASGIAFGQTRIGVHSGEVVVGNFGGSTIFDYRALGDPVNTTSRLESLNQHVGTRVCVSATIARSNPQVPMRGVGKVQLKGKSAAVEVFEPLEALDDAYDAAYLLLMANDPGALAAFAVLHEQRPEDGLVRFHWQRLQAGEQGDAFVMSRK
jgi:adenylate cyclase